MLTNKTQTSTVAGLTFQLPPFKIMVSLLIVYLIWGSTYIALHEAVEHIPPFLMNGIRFTVAGGALLIILTARGEPLPTRLQWRNAFLVGSLMTGISSGFLAYSAQYVASGLAALIIGAIPLWTALFATFWERRPNRAEGMGLLLGFVGIGILNVGTDMWANPWGGVLLFLAPIIWSFGLIWGRQLDMPKGMMNSGALLLCGGVLLTTLGFLRGERITEVPPTSALVSWIYLIVFGSMIAFSAFNYLVQTTQPVLATSYAYVNPIVAVLLGWLILDEGITYQTILAGALITAAVAFITLQGAQRGKRLSRTIKQP